jgi:hypothetical protein
VRYAKTAGEICNSRAVVGNKEECKENSTYPACFSNFLSDLSSPFSSSRISCAISSYASSLPSTGKRSPLSMKSRHISLCFVRCGVNVPFSGFSNLDSTSLTCGSRSGAERRSPRIVFDPKVSEASANLERASLNPLKDCRKGVSKENDERMYHHLQQFQEILDFAVLGVNARNNTLQIRKTFSNPHELSLKGRMAH